MYAPGTTSTSPGARAMRIATCPTNHVIELVITTARLGKWFEEVGTPVTGARRPPAGDVLEHFLAVSRKYGYWLGTPDDNAAVGLRLPEVSS